MTLVKLAADHPDNDMERLQIEELPAIVFYDKKFPTTFKGTDFSRYLIQRLRELASVDHATQEWNFCWK